MAGKSDLRKVLEKVGAVFGREALWEIADKAKTSRRAQMSATMDELCKRFDYDLEEFWYSTASNALSRDDWNDILEEFGGQRRKSFDDIFDDLVERL